MSAHPYEWLPSDHPRSPRPERCVVKNCEGLAMVGPFCWRCNEEIVALDQMHRLAVDARRHRREWRARWMERWARRAQTVALVAAVFGVLIYLAAQFVPYGIATARLWKWLATGNPQ